MDFCIIGLGANLEQPIAQLQQACETLRYTPEIAHFSVSSLYASKPMGPQDQPDYVNAVAHFQTSLEPLALLDRLQHIENNQGRIRKERWGARTLDLDLLFYGEQQIESERLTVPHPGVLEREFVIIPLAELLPNWQLPNGQTAQVYATVIDRKGIQRLL